MNSNSLVFYHATLAYPGASFTQVEGDKIRWQRNYFDRQTVAEQPGLKAK